MFCKFIEDKDLEDPYTLKFVAQNFLDVADALAYSARKRKQEVEREKIERARHVKHLREEAKAERQVARGPGKKKKMLRSACSLTVRYVIHALLGYALALRECAKLSLRLGISAQSPYAGMSTKYLRGVFE